jgi:glycosyltransferase involved in cell wall biosynthesis
MAQENVQIPMKDKQTEKGIVRICTAGRLVSEKGYDRLIAASKRLHEENYHFSISIMGMGADSYRKILERLIQSNEASSYIHMLGFQKNPYAIMKNSDVYVLSSREEGLATVLTEALFMELPIVATDVSGTKEVLGNHDEYGIVVDNSEEGIYQGLKRILENPKLLQYYKGKSKERAAFFAPEKTVKQAETLIDKVVGI